MEWRKMKETILRNANCNMRIGEVQVIPSKRWMCSFRKLKSEGKILIYAKEPEKVQELWEENPMVYWSVIVSRRLNDILYWPEDQRGTKKKEAKMKAEWVLMGGEKVYYWAHTTCPGSHLKVFNPYERNVDDIVLFCSACLKQVSILEIRKLDERG